LCPRQMLASLFVLLFSIIGTIAQNGGVTVLLNDTRVSYLQNGIPVTFAHLTTNSSAVFGSKCGSFLSLFDVNVSASLVFNGTSFSIGFLLYPQGGPANVLLDGSLLQLANNYGPNADPFSSQCQLATVSKADLAQGLHNVTVSVSNGTSTVTLLQNFAYADLATTDTSSSQPSETTSRSFGQVLHSPINLGKLVGLWFLSWLVTTMAT